MPRPTLELLTNARSHFASDNCSTYRARHLSGTPAIHSIDSWTPATTDCELLRNPNRAIYLHGQRSDFLSNCANKPETKNHKSPPQPSALHANDFYTTIL